MFAQKHTFPSHVLLSLLSFSWQAAIRSVLDVGADNRREDVCVVWLTQASVFFFCLQYGEEEFSHAELGKTDMLACLPASSDSTITLLSCTQMNTGLQKCKCCLLSFTFQTLHMVVRQFGILISPQGCWDDIYTDILLSPLCRLSVSIGQESAYQIPRETLISLLAKCLVFIIFFFVNK